MDKGINKKMSIHRRLKVFGRWLFVSTKTLAATMAVTLAMAASVQIIAAEPDIKPDWKKYKVGLDFVDPENRIIVAGDREFSVPFNTPIYNSDQRAIAVANLRAGTKVWLYLDNRSFNEGMTEAKRIEQVK